MPWHITIADTSISNLPTWRHFFDQLPRKCIYHAPDYIRFLEQHRGDTAELFVFGDERQYVYYPYFKKPLSSLALGKRSAVDLAGYYDVSSSWYYGGPIVKCATDHKLLAQNFIAAFSTYARQSKFVTEFVRFDPNIANHLPFQDHYAIEENRETVYIDLTRDTGEIWSGFTTANRRNIRRAEHEGVHCEPTSAVDDWRTFAMIYAEEMLRKEGPQHLRFSHDFFLDLRQTLGHTCQLIAARYEGELAGGFIVLHDDSYAFHFLSASRPEFWGKRVNNRLFYGAIMWARHRGLRILDFMGGREGVFRFKAGFSPLRGIFRVAKKVHIKELYDEISRITGPKGSHWFPPYRHEDVCSFQDDRACS